MPEFRRDADKRLTVPSRPSVLSVCQKLEQQGIAYVLSAGNDSDDLFALRRAGLDVPSEADDNLLANAHNIVVGSFSPRGTLDPRDDAVSYFSSSYDQVDFLAQGEQVETAVRGQTYGELQGTSYAAPNLAGRLLAVMRDHPAASLQESVAILRNQAGTAIPGVDLPVIR